jgi:hypothetical protein
MDCHANGAKYLLLAQTVSADALRYGRSRMRTGPVIDVGLAAVIDAGIPGVEFMAASL